MTQTAEKALESVYKSLGGTTQHPDMATFKSQLQNASPQQVKNADEQIWREIITPLAKEGQPIPQDVAQQCALVAERMHKLFTESTVGASSSR